MQSGLNLFVGNAHAAIPTWVPRRPLCGAQVFEVPMSRCNLMKRKALSALLVAPQRKPNTNPTKVACDDGMLVDGPMEGRPPGTMWAHQGWGLFPPQIAVEQWQKGAEVCRDHASGVSSYVNCSIDATSAIKPCFRSKMAEQSPLSVWTFGETVPPKLLLGRHGEPILFRHHNFLPAKVTSNHGFGRNTISTHEHSGHHGAETDSFTGAFLFPGQYYGYHWPIVHADFRTINISKAKFVFESRCASCHTISGGDRIGPHLPGVAERRDPASLQRYLKKPEKVLAEGDPTATALFAKYNRVNMPNLNLGTDDIATTTSFLAAQPETTRAKARLQQSAARDGNQGGEHHHQYH